MKKYYAFSVFVFLMAVTTWWAWSPSDTPAPARTVASVDMEEETLAADFFDNLDRTYEKHKDVDQGTAICKHFMLKNESSGMYSFMQGVTSFMNGFCMPGSFELSHIEQDFDRNTKLFMGCCDKYYGMYRHHRYEVYSTDRDAQNIENGKYLKQQGSDLREYLGEMRKHLKF